MKTKRSVIFLTVIAVIFAFVLGMILWNANRRQPIDVTMYGAEIKTDGTVVTETEFRLNGYMIDNRQEEPLKPWLFYLDPITFSNISNYSVDMISCEDEPLLLKLDDPYYHGHWGAYSDWSNQIEEVHLYWTDDFSCCILCFEGRWIVGSTDPAMSVSQILAKFPEVTLE